ncbi:MAG: hypothetical protein BZ138_00370 [Methanosphaera sp. rholeuAM270]|nr:MAG: hypothetical protein BZ138_00370 [Methanosphaera sp. rholeuAM270]
MRNKILLPIICVLSVVFIASFFILSPIYITDNGDTKHFDDKDMSFDMSNEWTVYEYDDILKTPFLSSSPDSLILNPVSKSRFTNYAGNLDDLEDDVINTSATNDFDVAIVKTEITKHDSLPNGVTLNDAYKADSLYSLMSSTGGFNLVEDKELNVNGKNAHQFIYTVSSVTYQDTWVENNGHFIRVLSQAPNGFYNDAQKEFDYLISTLNVK